MAKVTFEQGLIRRWEIGEQLARYHMSGRKIRNYSGSCVYFLKNAARPRLIKIGFTNHVYQRMRRLELEWGQPCELVAIAFPSIGCNTAVLEHSIHDELQNYRVDGEWFQLDATLSWVREQIS